MKKQLSIAVIALLCGCGTSTSTDKTAVVAGRTVKEVTITEGQPIATADLGITGMTCEQMCGGMIKGALTKLPGVAGTEITFKDGDEVGYAKVTYDPAKVDDAQLVKAVQDLADGQYKVISLGIVKEVKSAPSACKQPDGKNDGVNACIIPEVTMPNLVSTLLALVRI